MCKTFPGVVDILSRGVEYSHSRFDPVYPAGDSITLSRSTSSLHIAKKRIAKLPNSLTQNLQRCSFMLVKGKSSADFATRSWKARLTYYGPAQTNPKRRISTLFFRPSITELSLQTLSTLFPLIAYLGHLNNHIGEQQQVGTGRHMQAYAETRTYMATHLIGINTLLE